MSTRYVTVDCTATYLLVRTVLHHGSALHKGMKRTKGEEDYIPAKFLRYYSKVPDR